MQCVCAYVLCVQGAECVYDVCARCGVIGDSATWRVHVGASGVTRHVCVHTACGCHALRERVSPLPCLPLASALSGYAVHLVLSPCPRGPVPAELLT